MSSEGSANNTTIIKRLYEDLFCDSILLQEFLVMFIDNKLVEARYFGFDSAGGRSIF
jgi:hypothetical protein